MPPNDSSADFVNDSSVDLENDRSVDFTNDSGSDTAIDTPCEIGPNHEFQTIASALSAMKDGETCIVNEGVYREKLDISLNNIKLIGKGRVVITGNDVVQNMQACTINGVRCLTKSVKTPVYDVFCDNQYMLLSRYPDKSAQMTSNEDWVTSFIGPAGNIALANNAQRDIQDLNDGYYIGMHGPFGAPHGQLASWFSISLPITGLTEPGEYIAVDKDNVSSGYMGKYGEGDGVGYIIGAKAVLDSPGEWHTDGQKVTLIPPMGGQLQDRCEFRTRLYVAVIKGSGVHLENILFRAGSVRVEGNDVSITNSTFEYISPFRHVPNPKNEPENKEGQSMASCWGTPDDGTLGVFVGGDGFRVRNCVFSKSWWAGLTIKGNQALVENCVFEDVNWMAKRSAGLFSWGNDNVARNNTFRNLGASAIEGGNAAWIRQYAKRNIWEYNYIKNATQLVVDQGLFYVNHQRGSNPKANSIWRYNIGVGSSGPKLGDWRKTLPGWYVDNNSSGYKIHNNIVINAVMGALYNDNRDGADAGKDIWYYNNTFFESGALPLLGPRAGTTPDAEIFLYNNLAVDCTNCTTESGYFSGWDAISARDKNLEFASPLGVFADASNMDFTPIEPNVISGAVAVDGQAIDYIGAVDPTSGMWSYGADESLLPEHID